MKDAQDHDSTIRARNLNLFPIFRRLLDVEGRKDGRKRLPQEGFGEVPSDADAVGL